MALGRSSGREDTTTGPARGKPGRRLTGWKEIGAFFGKNERTVKRWESQRGLPIHRAPGGAKTAVFADVLELEEWLKGSRAAVALGEAAEALQAPLPVPDEMPSVVPDGAAPAWFAWRRAAIAALALLAIGLILAYPALRSETRRLVGS